MAIDTPGRRGPPRSGCVEPLRRADGTTYFRARILLADDTRVRVDVPERYSHAAGGLSARERAELYAAALQEREDETGELLAARTAKRAEASAGTIAEYFGRWNAARAVKYPRQAKTDAQTFALRIRDPLGALSMRDPDLRSKLIAFSHDLDTTAAAGDEFGEKRARNIFSVVAAMFRDAYSHKNAALRVLDSNPCDGVPWPERSETQALKQLLYPHEFLALVTCPDVPVLRARLYAVTLATTTRAAEVRVFEPHHFDVRHGSVQILGADDPSTRKATGSTATKSTKSGKARLCTLERTLAPVVEAMIAERGSGRLFPQRPSSAPKGNQWRPASAEYIPREDGEYGLCATFKRDLRRALEWAGIAIRPELFDDSNRRASISIRFHDLRASGITWRHARGDNPEQIRQECGHEDQATNQIYIRALRGLDAGALFPVLPDRLLGTARPNRAELVPSAAGGAVSTAFLVGAEGFEPPTSTV